jgi:hypothetical protein
LARNGDDDSDNDGLLARDEYPFRLSPLVDDVANPARRTRYTYTANDELAVYSPVVGGPATYTPDPEGNLQP